MSIKILFATSNEFMVWLQKLQDFVESNGFDGANYKKNRVTWLSDEDNRTYTAITHQAQRPDEYFKHRCLKVRIDKSKLKFILCFTPKDSHNDIFLSPDDAYLFITTSLLSGEIQGVIGYNNSEIAQPTDLILASMPTHIADLVKQRLNSREEIINNQFFALRLFPDIDSYKEICKNGDSKAWLLDRFSWGGSREGHFFWESIHTAFVGKGHLIETQ